MISSYISLLELRKSPLLALKIIIILLSIHVADSLKILHYDAYFWGWMFILV